MNKFVLTGIVMIVAGALTGCETTGDLDDGGVDGAGGGGAPVSSDVGGAGTSGATRPSGFQGNPLDDPDSLLAERVIYFDFDQSTIREEYRAVIAAHADYLAGNSGATVTLEGHADERGSREYNIGLGERRAQSVGNLLAVQGASQAQLDLVSYGEERPADPASNESAWAKNRRVEIVYQR